MVLSEDFSVFITILALLWGLVLLFEFYTKILSHIALMLPFSRMVPRLQRFHPKQATAVRL